MSQPAVSVVLPTFNRLNYLRPAVDSVFAQTFADWELIVVDDGSEGETAAYLTALENRPRVTLIRLAHTGNPGVVRNAGWRAARGEYIAFLDSDDVWLPRKLASQVRSLASHPERGWSHTAFAVIDEFHTSAGASARWWPADQGWILDRIITMETVIAMPSVIVRRGLLEQVGGFDVGQRMCEDYDLWLRLAAVSQIDGVPEMLLLVRRHREHFHRNPVVFEELDRALMKQLAVSTDPRLQSILSRQRAKVAVRWARSLAVDGRRRAAWQTLLSSSRYAWGYGEWWLRGTEAAVRAAAPAVVVRAARALVRRDRS